MLKKEIQNFIDDIMESENCKGQFHVIFSFIPNKDMIDCSAAVRILKLSKDDSIADGVMMDVNRKIFSSNKEYDILYQKSCILHEMGHVFTCSSRNSRREYRAHKWAYNKAIQLGMNDVADRVKSIIERWECSQKSGRYYKAFIMAKNQKFI